MNPIGQFFLVGSPGESSLRILVRLRSYISLLCCECVVYGQEKVVSLNLN